VKNALQPWRGSVDRFPPEMIPDRPRHGTMVGSRCLGGLMRSGGGGVGDVRSSVGEVRGVVPSAGRAAPWFMVGQRSTGWCRAKRAMTGAVNACAFEPHTDIYLHQLDGRAASLRYPIAPSTMPPYCTQNTPPESKRQPTSHSPVDNGTLAELIHRLDDAGGARTSVRLEWLYVQRSGGLRS
jgi:hypothetical protein